MKKTNMNKLLVISTLTILLINLAVITKAQTASISDVKAFYLRNVDAIVENDEVKGYLAFYMVDKKNSKENNYKLVIWDNNLNKKFDINLVRPKLSYFLESSYNGDAFCYSFYSAKEKKLDYIVYNKSGKKTGTYSVPKLSKYEIMGISSRAQAENNEYFGGLISIPTKGFVRYGLDPEKGRQVLVELIDTSAKKKWSKTLSGYDKNDYLTAMPLCYNKDFIVTTVYMRESMLSQNIKDSYVKFQDAATGNDIFNFKTKTDKYQYSMYGAYLEGSDICTYGEYFLPKDNIFKDESTGLFFMTLDQSGKVIRESYLSWDEEITKKYPQIVSTEKGKSVKVAMHRMIKTADGNYFVICEQFNRAADAAGIAMRALTRDSNAAVTKMVIRDMVILQLDENLKLINVEVIAKEKSSVHLTAGFDYLGSVFIAYYLKSTGQFDYCYTNLSPDKKTFTTSYINYDREAEGSNYVIGTISYNKDQKIVSDKIPMTTKPYRFTVYPSKPGFISIFEYFKKTKTATIRLEKLNL